jgi:hypothetical protein
MNPKPLTATQIKQFSSKVANGRLKRVPIDLTKAEMFLDKASEALAEFTNISSTGVLYDTAYTVCHDVGEAAMAAYGFRTSPFDDLRRSRNSRLYGAKPIGKSLSTLGVQTARALFAEAKIQLN